jgi:hypothetical protein
LQRAIVVTFGVFIASSYIPAPFSSNTSPSSGPFQQHPYLQSIHRRMRYMPIADWRLHIPRVRHELAR